ncbi:GAF domain-containing protein [Spirulina subsalsa]|uniref:GAF domain-containing protein n=1 Tax=Spirulina subsalsa TaxID=54311 RepID=UPI0002E16FD7|nr:GAF domain-containing protein [Spirulina subsalsa]
MNPNPSPSASKTGQSTLGTAAASSLGKAQNYKKLLALVLEWTDKEPFLTQILFKLMMEEKTTPKTGQEEVWMENLVRSRVLHNWEQNPRLKPLWSIRDRLLKSKDKKRSLQLLKFYKQVFQEEGVFANTGSEQKELRLLGLIAKQQGKLKVHNKIYELIFSEEWVDQAIETLENDLEPSEEDYLRIFTQLERKLFGSQVDIIRQIEQGNDDQEVTQPLYEVLRDVTTNVGELVGSDRTSIFLLNEEKTELWSLVAEDESGHFLDIHVRMGEGITGLVAKNKQVIHIPDHVYEDPRSQLVKEFDKKYNYHTQNILAFPILNDEQEVIAVVQLLNKLKKRQQDIEGFTHLDLERLAKCVLPIRRILETCQSCYESIKKAQATAALRQATRSLDQVNLDTQMILERVMNAAKKLLNADRSTLWLVDEEKGDLWTEIPGDGKIRCPIGTGFVGQVAQSRQAMIIPYDLYDDPNAENAKKTDEHTHYRTCSLLCMPVLSPSGKLLGVTQLVNKRKAGATGEYDKSLFPAVPPFFKASFDKNDRHSMQIFNERVGAILQFAKTHEKLKESAKLEPQAAVLQTLNLFSNVLDNGSEQGYETVYTLIKQLSHSLKRQLKAEFCHIFMLSVDQQDLWLFYREAQTELVKTIILTTQQGIAVKVLTAKEAKKSNKAGQIRDQLVRVGLSSKQVGDLKSVLLFPLVDGSGNAVALIRLLNKIDYPDGFTAEDVDFLKQKSRDVLPILQGFQSFSSSL